MGDTARPAAGQTFPPMAGPVMGDTRTTKGGIFLFPAYSLAFLNEMYATSTNSPRLPAATGSNRSPVILPR